jgi:diketogulonate reductase-like aldo/keto reductase
VVDYCGREEIAFLAYSPTGGGRLNKKLGSVGIVHSLAEWYGRSHHAIVLAWVLAQGPTVIAIPSARQAENAEDSAAAGDLQLSAADLAALDAAHFDRS